MRRIMTVEAGKPRKPWFSGEDVQSEDPPASCTSTWMWVADKFWWFFDSPPISTFERQDIDPENRQESPVDNGEDKDVVSESWKFSSKNRIASATFVCLIKSCNESKFRKLRDVTFDSLSIPWLNRSNSIRAIDDLFKSVFRRNLQSANII